MFEGEFWDFDLKMFFLDKTNAFNLKKDKPLQTKSLYRSYAGRCLQLIVNI